MDNQGIAKLAKVLQGRAKEQFMSTGRTFEFATITEEYSLEPDSSPGMIIPKEDYLVLEHLTYPETINTEPTVIGDTGEHTHKIKCENIHRNIGIGDRVIIAWIGNDVVVLGRYTSGKGLTTVG